RALPKHSAQRSPRNPKSLYDAAEAAPFRNIQLSDLHEIQNPCTARLKPRPSETFSSAISTKSKIPPTARLKPRPSETFNPVISTKIQNPCLLPLPHRRAFFEKGLNALACVLGLHQVLEINFFGASETFVEVHSVPGVKSFFGDGEGGGTELPQIYSGLVHCSIELFSRQCAVGQTDARRLAT